MASIGRISIQRSRGILGRTIRIVLVFGACSLGVSIGPDALADDSPRQWSAIEKWMLEVESVHLPTGETADQGNQWSTCRIVAASASDEVYYFLGHKQETLGTDWRNEPFNIEITLQDGQQVSNHKFNRRVEFLSVPKGTQIPPPLQADVLFFFFPVWPLKSYPPPSQDGLGMTLVVGAALGNASYKSTSKRKLICGVSCTEFASPKGNDRIWVADSKDLCVMRREWFYSDTAALAGQILTRKIVQVSDGLWLPVEVECLTFASPVDNNTSIPTSRTMTHLSNWKFNDDVPSSIFQPALKPGSIEMSKFGVPQQLSPGGVEHINEMAEFYRGPIRLPHRIPASKMVMSGLIRFLTGCLGGVLIGLCVRRSFGSTTPPSNAQLGQKQERVKAAM